MENLTLTCFNNKEHNCHSWIRKLMLFSLDIFQLYSLFIEICLACLTKFNTALNTYEICICRKCFHFQLFSMKSKIASNNHNIHSIESNFVFSSEFIYVFILFVCLFIFFLHITLVYSNEYIFQFQRHEFFIFIFNSLSAIKQQ